MFKKTLDILLEILVVFPKIEPLRSKVTSFIHRMVETLGSSVFPYLPKALEQLLAESEPKEMVAFLVLINQLICKFSKLVKDILEEIFPIIASRVFHVLPRYAFPSEPGGNTEVSKFLFSTKDARVLLQQEIIFRGVIYMMVAVNLTSSSPSKNLNELQVNYNNDRSRDYTNSSLPSEQKGRSSQHGYGEAASMHGLPQMGNAATAAAAAFGGGLPPGVSGTNERCTVLASNLNEEKITEDKLFNLFSIYGNIVRIKILCNKPDHALIQMGDGFQAELAVHFLKGSMLFGKRLEVNFSKHSNIIAGADTHEYANSNLNRFNRNASKNYRYCCSPTKMIHLSSLPQEITEEDIVGLLEEHGNIVNTKVFDANSKKQALLLFENEDEATEALVCKHATNMNRSVIRISFSQLQNI